MLHVVISRSRRSLHRGWFHLRVLMWTQQNCCTLKIAESDLLKTFFVYNLIRTCCGQLQGCKRECIRRRCSVFRNNSCDLQLTDMTRSMCVCTVRVMSGLLVTNSMFLCACVFPQISHRSDRKSISYLQFVLGSDCCVLS